MMASTDYMTSQQYNATIGGVDYNVSVSMGGSAAGTLPAATAVADDATPSVAGVNVLYVGANTGATAITQLDGAASNQFVILVCTSSTNSSTITDGGNFALNGNWSPNVDDTIMLLTANGTAWREICRSAN